MKIAITPPGRVSPSKKLKEKMKKEIAAKILEKKPVVVDNDKPMMKAFKKALIKKLK